MNLDFLNSTVARVCCQYVDQSTNLRQKCCYSINTVELHMLSFQFLLLESLGEKRETLKYFVYTNRRESSPKKKLVAGV